MATGNGFLESAPFTSAAFRMMTRMDYPGARRTSPSAVHRTGLLSTSILLVLVFSLCLTSHAQPSEQERDRPKIGLALGGGGAKGFAHIGVLKVLEENRVPVDYIAGTSMGAIIAGLYATGMTPDQIEAELVKLDWWDLLDDQTERPLLSYRRKLEDGRYLLDLELGIGKSGLRMPNATAAGQKFNNLMQFLTLNAETLRLKHFDQLPIPFRAICTDLKTGEAVVLDHGNLGTAMRASMAVPGVFTPVEWEGRLLVDGGIVNNIPVDVVRGMGADIVIAVDLGAKDVLATSESLDSLGGILAQTYQLMRRPGQDAQMKNADVAILPDTSKFSSGEFHKVGEIIPLGRTGALVVKDDMHTYALGVEAYAAHRSARLRAGLGKSFRVDRVEFNGLHHVDSRSLRPLLRTRADTMVNVEDLQWDLGRIYARGDFQQVGFLLEPDEPGRGGITFDAIEKPWGPNFVHFGLKLETDTENASSWGLLVNLRNAQLNPMGGEWWTDLEIGDSRRFFSEFYQPLTFAGDFFIAPAIEAFSDLEDVYQDGSRIGEYRNEQLIGRIDIGIQLRHYAEARFGYFYGQADADVDTGPSDLPELDESYAGGVIQVTADRLDNTHFPTSGFLLDSMLILAQDELGSDRSFERLSIELKLAKKFGPHVISADLAAGSALDSDLPEYNAFLLGGPTSFSGLAPGQLRGSYLGTIALEYRYEISKLPPSLGGSVYITTRGDFGNVWQNEDDVDFDDTLLGGSVGLAADTILGPAYLGLGHAEGGDNLGFVALGADFGRMFSRSPAR